MSGPLPPSDNLLVPWLPFLDPLRLRQVTVDPRLLDWRRDTVPVFPSVRTLSLELAGERNNAENLLALSTKFPAAQSLTLYSFQQISEPLIAACGSLLHRATTLCVPFDALRFCLPRTKNLATLNVGRSPTASELIHQLKNNKFPSITTLVCGLDAQPGSPGPTDFAAILGAFPQLRHLRMRITNNTLPRANDILYGRASIRLLESLLSTSPVIFPQSITTIVMSVFRLPSSRDADPIPLLSEAEAERRGRLPDAATIRDSIIERHPALTSLWIQVRSILIVWRRRPSDGLVTKSICTEDPEDVRGRNPAPFVFWESRED
ncbi:hypothetical protein HMN09_01118100 [Mycena chlorophos]|uniref:F-box domain-containing protein n=1 Tax=Mycena chlorophos TaxID=658473 RepID=A0A8H6VXQ7_MYCCL|nr:hypothetical protein HMN09_01118100 [Mycena chlorophos]